MPVASCAPYEMLVAEQPVVSAIEQAFVTSPPSPCAQSVWSGIVLLTSFTDSVELKLKRVAPDFPDFVVMMIAPSDAAAP